MLAAQIKVNIGAMHHRVVTKRGKVITVQGNVKHAYRHFAVFNSVNFGGNALCQRYAACADADDNNVLNAFVFLDNFVRNADKRPSDGFAVHNNVFLNN